MKKTRSVAMMMAIAFTAVSLAGCASSSQKSTTAPAEKESKAEESTETLGDAGGWKSIGKKDEPVEVKVVIKDVFPDEEDVVSLTKAIEEKMAVHGQYIKLTFEEPPADSYKTAMPLAVMNGEVDADLIYFQGGDQAVSAQGLIEDWTPYIKEAKYIPSLMDESNIEKMKNYPYLLWLAPPRVSTPAIRSDIAAQLSTYDALVADPTVDNYYAMFQEMVQKGLVKYAIDMDGSLDRLNSIFNHAFGVTGTCVEEDGKWIFSKASKAEKEKLAFYAKLYANGLLDPEFLTDTWDVMEQKFYDGKTGIICGTAGGVIQVYNTKSVQTNGKEAELLVLPPAKGVSQSYTSIDVTKEGRGFALNANSDDTHKQAAVALLDFMASPEGRILDKVGVEGKQYTIEDNTIVFTDAFAGWWARFWDTTNHFNPENPSLKEPVLSAAAQDSLDKVKEYMVLDHNLLIPEEMAAQWDAMNNLYNEYASDIVRGERPIDDFDKFVQEWNKAGGDAFEPILAEKFK